MPKDNKLINQCCTSCYLLCCSELCSLENCYSAVAMYYRWSITISLWHCCLCTF